MATQYGRKVVNLSISEQIRLPADGGLLTELLQRTKFFTSLTVKVSNIAELLADEIQLLLPKGWYNQDAAEVLRTVLNALVDPNSSALKRVYSTPANRKRVEDAIRSALDNGTEFTRTLTAFAAIHNLFAPNAPSGKERHPLHTIIDAVIDSTSNDKPYVVINLSDTTGLPELARRDMKARLIRKISSELNRLAELRWKERGNLANCAVIFDEAHRYAPADPDPDPESDEVATLASKLSDYVRETRKTGLGWTFITQEIRSLHPGIYAQLGIRCFGYGLISGTDLNKLKDEIGAGAAMELYKSFTNPQATSKKRYPFMISGPVSPLSFTAAPVFLDVYTDEEEFRQMNQIPGR
ncbi:hypothetical protein ASE16_01990 [Leifsonia sp. Root227]|uniref:ATP-binding protein n=1 Tax=Leifsonia sp. Root227 TaxID=1736496 RepID=UPI0006FBC3E5|nr:ATP-binding protein [Leifsonia sp. Root227]KRC51863.1 hypothetical protein ASE16_01990 [Leifsonia sp. Root227]